MATKIPESTTPPTQPGAQPPRPSGGTQQRAEEGRPPSSAAESPSQPQSAPQGQGRAISERKGQFLIAARRPQGMQLAGLQPLQFAAIEKNLRESKDIEVVDTVGPKNIVGVLANGMTDVPSVIVARMTEQKASILHQQAQGRLIVERDQSLNLLDAPFSQPTMVSGLTPVTGPTLTANVLVLGKDNAPVRDAEVYLFGSMLPATGVTDEKGMVTLSLFGETPQSVRSLYVKPKSDYWSFYQQQPDISTDEPNVVGLRPLSELSSLSNFPEQQVLGWGQKAMRLDQLPETYRGQGVKVAVIDSGAATTHVDLRKIRFGFDVINKKTNPNTWNEDVIAHGSHCAGIIAGADNNTGVRGFAPDAEIHACKLFPGGQVSQLIDALEYCIERQIDVVNMSLGGVEPSEALEQQIIRAKRAGVACIVAAGNSGGRVQYPASSPNVLAVSAIGKLNEFPQDSYHSQTLTPLIDMNGFFAAKFSCFGPEVSVCAPGVAIPSSVPPDNYAAWDGTSMAAPHVTGLAALVLAHHPDFQGAFKARGPERVERLFQIIRLSARRINIGDVSRTGYGLPDVMIALGLQPQVMQSPAAAVAGAMQASPQSLMSLWGQAGQASPLGGGLGVSGVEPYAAYMQPYFFPPLTSPIQGMAFGMAPGFGRSGW